MGTRADVEADADGRLRDVGPHPPPGGRGAAVPDRPGAPARAPDGEREPPAARRAGTHAARERGARARGHRAPGRGLPRTAAAAATRTADPAPRRARAPSRGQARVAAARAACRTTRLRRLIRPVFGRIDHIGVAVEDLDEAIALYGERLGMPLQHRETVEEQGVEAVLLGVGDSHVELLRPLGPDTAVGKFLERSGPGLHHVAYGTDDIDSALEAVRDAGLAADRRAAPHRHPRQPRGVPAPEVDRRGAHRAGRAPGESLMADAPRRIDIGFQGGQVLPVRVSQEVHDELPQGAVELERGPLVRAAHAGLGGPHRPVAGRVREARHRRPPGGLLDVASVRGARPPAAAPASHPGAHAGPRAGDDPPRAVGRERAALERDRRGRRRDELAPARGLRARDRDRAGHARPQHRREVRGAAGAAGARGGAARAHAGAVRPLLSVGARVDLVRRCAGAGLGRRCPSAPLHAVAVAMALSRPYLGVHYPSDVVAGAFLGDAVARLMTAVTREITRPISSVKSMPAACAA